MEAYPSVPSQGFGVQPYDYIMSAGVIGMADRTPKTVANLVAWRFLCDGQATIDTVRIWLKTSQTGAEVRGGIYTNQRARPAALIADIGTKSLATGTDVAVDWSGLSVPVGGYFWCLLWMKNVATQATVTGPGDLSNTVDGFPIIDAFLQYPTVHPWLYLEAAYPGSMPATAPAVGNTFEVGVPLPIVRLI